MGVSPLNKYIPRKPKKRDTAEKSVDQLSKYSAHTYSATSQGDVRSVSKYPDGPIEPKTEGTADDQLPKYLRSTNIASLKDENISLYKNKQDPNEQPLDQLPKYLGRTNIASLQGGSSPSTKNPHDPRKPQTRDSDEETPNQLSMYLRRTNIAKSQEERHLASTDHINVEEKQTRTVLSEEEDGDGTSLDGSKQSQEFRESQIETSQNPQVQKSLQFYTGINETKRNEYGGCNKGASLSAKSKVDKNGGTLQISNTNVKLKIPEGALEGEHELQIRIIPNCFLEEHSPSFCSNSSVVVEILPRDLELKHPAKLTLPHCLLLNKDEECYAEAYSCAQIVDTRPLWEKIPTVSPRVEDEWCIIELNRFSLKTSKIFNRKAKGKKIKLYLARSKNSTDLETRVEIGWYRDMPGENEVIWKKNDLLDETSFLFTKRGKMPIQVTFEVAKSTPWINMETTNIKEITYEYINSSTEYSCKFKLKKNVEEPGVMCSFTVQQAYSNTPVELMNHIENPSPSQLDQNSNFQIPQPANPDDCVPMDVLECLSQKISKKWRKVGRKLELDDEELDNIVANIPGDQEEQVYEMFKTWSHRRGQDATYRVLRKALIAAGRKDLADKMC